MGKLNGTEFNTGDLVQVKNYGTAPFKISGWVKDTSTFDSPVLFFFIEGIVDNVFKKDELTKYVDEQYPIIPWKNS